MMSELGDFHTHKSFIGKNGVARRVIFYFHKNKRSINAFKQEKKKYSSVDNFVLHVKFAFKSWEKTAFKKENQVCISLKYLICIVN